MAEGEFGSGGAAIKRYQLFDVEQYEDKPVKKAKGAEISAEEGSAVEPKVKLAGMISSQGLAVINDVWFILGTSKPFEPEATEDQHVLFVAVKGITISAVQSHAKNFGIWGGDKMKFIVTVGEDQYSEGGLPGAGKKPAPMDSGKKQTGIVIKIWDADLLQDNKYKTISEYDKEDPSGKIIPRIIPLNIALPFSQLCSMSVSKDMTHVALGLVSGMVIIVRATAKTSEGLNNAQPKDIQILQFKPDSGYERPVTNIHLDEAKSDKGIPGYYVYCTSDKSYYYYHTSDKKGGFILIEKEAGAMPKEMDACNDQIVFLSSTGGILRKFKGRDPEASWPMKDKGVYISK